VEIRLAAAYDRAIRDTTLVVAEKRGGTLKRILILVGLATALVAGVTTSASASDPNLCANGGWQSLQTDRGHEFRSENACVSYAIHGGTLFRPVVDLIPRCFTFSTELEITASGFHQHSVVVVTIRGATFLDGSTHRTFVTGTDETSVGILGGIKVQPILAPPLFSTSLVTITIRDEQGVHAEASTLMWCAPPPP